MTQSKIPSHDPVAVLREKFDKWYFDPDRKDGTIGYQGTREGIADAFQEMAWRGYRAAATERAATQPAGEVPMRDDTITVIPQNMREYKLSVREADFENDIFSDAFDSACKEGQVSQCSEEAMLGADWFKDGWTAAVRCLAAPISEDTAKHAFICICDACSAPSASAEELPPPFAYCVINGADREYNTIEEFSGGRRKGIALYTAEQVRDAIAADRAARTPASAGSLTDAQVDDMAFGYAPSGHISELRELIRVVELHARATQPEADARVAREAALEEAALACEAEYKDSPTMRLVSAGFAEKIRALKSTAPAAPDSAREDERRHGTLYDAIQRACAELPDDYGINIELERGCGAVVWSDPEANYTMIEGEGYLCSDVEEALDAILATKGKA